RRRRARDIGRDRRNRHNQSRACQNERQGDRFAPIHIQSSPGSVFGIKRPSSDFDNWKGTATVGVVMRRTVGGGAKKVLYALETARKAGLVRTAKALTSKNACKACGLGMGGQKGGMTNEAGEFPAVCNKSVQAQSSDVQPAIPVEVLTHP